jgi:hypothetical protein
MNPSAANFCGIIRASRRRGLCAVRWADLSYQSDTKIFRAETGVLGQPREHPRADLFVIVKGEHDIGPALAGKRSVRT